MSTPALGRVVHYWSGQDIFAAMITGLATHEGELLTIFTPNGPYISRVKHSPDKVLGTWHWPEIKKEAESGKRAKE